MKRWYVGTNNYWYTASIGLEEAPWYIFALETAAQWTFDKIPSITLPPIKKKLSEEDAKFHGESYTTWKDWWGDTQQLFHVYVCAPVVAYCYSRIKDISISLPYTYIKEIFPKEVESREYDMSDYDKEETEEIDKRYLLALKTAEKFKTFQERLTHKYIEDHYGDMEL